MPHRLAKHGESYGKVGVNAPLSTALAVEQGWADLRRAAIEVRYLDDAGDSAGKETASHWGSRTPKAISHKVSRISGIAPAAMFHGARRWAEPGCAWVRPGSNPPPIRSDTEQPRDKDQTEDERANLADAIEAGSRKQVHWRGRPMKHDRHRQRAARQPDGRNSQGEAAPRRFEQWRAEHHNQRPSQHHAKRVRQERPTLDPAMLRP